MPTDETTPFDIHVSAVAANNMNSHFKEKKRRKKKSKQLSGAQGRQVIRKYKQIQALKWTAIIRQEISHLQQIMVNHVLPFNITCNYMTTTTTKSPYPVHHFRKRINTL